MHGSSYSSAACWSCNRANRSRPVGASAGTYHVWTCRIQSEIAHPILAWGWERGYAEKDVLYVGLSTRVKILSLLVALSIVSQLHSTTTGRRFVQAFLELGQVRLVIIPTLYIRPHP